jgi:hypothetical protein
MPTTTYQDNIAADNVTITASGLASLATSSTRLAGFSLALVDNRTNLDLDNLFSLLTTVGSAPTQNTQIDVWAILARSTVSGTLAWPDTFDGTAKAVTATSLGCLQSYGIPLKSFLVDATTSNRAYELVELSIASFNGGELPCAWQPFIAHNTGVNFNATGGNFTASYLRKRKTSS